MTATSILVAVGLSLFAALAVIALTVRIYQRRIQTYVQRTATDYVAKVQDQLQDHIAHLAQEIERGDVVMQGVRTERMKAVSTFRSLDRERGGSTSTSDATGELDPVSQQLMSVAQNPFVQGWAGKWGIDPVKFLQGNPAEVQKVEALLPAAENGAAPAPDTQQDVGAPAPRTGRRVL